MADYSVNKDAVSHLTELIEGRQYVLDSDWGDVQPSADDENAYLEDHSLGRVRGYGTSGSPKAPRTRRRPGTRSSPATSAASTAQR